MEYSTTFAAGTLLHEEMLRVIAEMEAGTPLAEVDPNVLDVNSRTGRERRLREVVRRLEQTDRRVWKDLLQRAPSEQRVILYYACLKAYSLVADIHMNVVLPAWRSLTQEVRRSDVQRFLDQQVDTHPEIDRWSENTHDKVQQVVRKMLAEVGLLREDRLQRINLPQTFWVRFARAGDVWFLEAMFLDKEERTEIVELVRGT